MAVAQSVDHMFHKTLLPDYFSCTGLTNACGTTLDLRVTGSNHVSQINLAVALFDRAAKYFTKNLVVKPSFFNERNYNE